MIPELSFLLFIPGTGGGEILIIFLVILVLFGPRRLPEVARSIGRVLEELRKASQDFKDQVMSIDVVDDKETIEKDWEAPRVAPVATQARSVSPYPECPEDAARMSADDTAHDLNHDEVVPLPNAEDESRND